MGGWIGDNEWINVSMDGWVDDDGWVEGGIHPGREGGGDGGKDKWIERL